LRGAEHVSPLKYAHGQQYTEKSQQLKKEEY